MLQIRRDAFISSAFSLGILPSFVTRTSHSNQGGICMISMYSQTAPSRSVLMLDAGIAR
jgi:hypothetical protein